MRNTFALCSLNHAPRKRNAPPCTFCRTFALLCSLLPHRAAVPAGEPNRFPTASSLGPGIDLALSYHSRLDAHLLKGDQVSTFTTPPRHWENTARGRTQRTLTHDGCGRGLWASGLRARCLRATGSPQLAEFT